MHVTRAEKLDVMGLSMKCNFEHHRGIQPRQVVQLCVQRGEIISIALATDQPSQMLVAFSSTFPSFEALTSADMVLISCIRHISARQNDEASERSPGVWIGL